MAFVSAIDRAGDARRFHNRCAYCRQRLAPGHHYDHVWPRHLGGDDALANLVPVCPTCNLAKGGTYGPVRDPYRGQLVPWFHPRRDSWDDHFISVENQIVGTSPVGRAASAILFRPLSAPRLDVVGFGPALIADDPGLIEVIQRLVGEQREGNFHASLRAGELLRSWHHSTSGDRWVADFATHWIPAMARWKRGTTADLRRSWSDSITYYRRGYESGSPAHGERFRREWVATNAILIATLLDDVGDSSKATRFRTFATMAYHRISVDEVIDDANLRLRAIANQMISEPSALSLDPSILAVICEQAGQLVFQAAGDFADAVVRAGLHVPWYEIERTWEVVDGLMQQAGYGAGGDIAEATGLRRRWWLLQMRLGEPLDMDLLKWDLEYWARSRLGSEVRLLRVDAKRLGVDVETA